MRKALDVNHYTYVYFYGMEKGKDLNITVRKDLNTLVRKLQDVDSGSQRVDAKDLVGLTTDNVTVRKGMLIYYAMCITQCYTLYSRYTRKWISNARVNVITSCAILDMA